MPVRTIYPTTKPTWYDTKAIAKAKMIQQLETPSSASAGMTAFPENTNNQFYDCEVKTLQRILLSLQ